MFSLIQISFDFLSNWLIFLNPKCPSWIETITGNICKNTLVFEVYWSVSIMPFKRRWFDKLDDIKLFQEKNNEILNKYIKNNYKGEFDKIKLREILKNDGFIFLDTI